jgi:hypothetical protein
MIPLKFGERASHENFSPDADEWDFHLVFNLEKEAIDNYLREQAGANWRELKSVQAAQEQMPDLNNSIAATYAPSGDKPIQRVYDDAARGSLRLEAPTNGKIRAMTTLLVLSVIAESTVMLIQQVLATDFNPFILVFAFMLAVGGFLQGHGVGNLIFRRWKEDTRRAEKGDRPLIYWIEVSVGTLLILLIASARSVFLFEPLMIFLLFSVTLFFGEAVSLFEALREKYKSMRILLLAEMLQAQKWQANMSHRLHLVQNGYRETYEAGLRRAEHYGSKSPSSTAWVGSGGSSKVDVPLDAKEPRDGDTIREPPRLDERYLGIYGSNSKASDLCGSLWKSRCCLYRSEELQPGLGRSQKRQRTRSGRRVYSLQPELSIFSPESVGPSVRVPRRGPSERISRLRCAPEGPRALELTEEP